MSKKKVTQSQDEAAGIECPRCGCRHFYTRDTRKKGNSVVRIKECRHCGRRARTVEVMAK